MCGRYTLVNLAHLLRLFPWIHDPPPNAVPRYNIAPSQSILAVANDNPDQFDHFVWGLIPSWAKDPKIANNLCNARAETLPTKNTFKNAYRRRRCLIPADGFYEWKLNADGKTKQPMYIRLKSGSPFSLAGLWETWHAPDGQAVRSATIITTKPNELMATIHDRMPVVLRAEDQKRWLDSGENAAELLMPYPADKMDAYPVSRQVNSPRNDGAELIAAIKPDRSTLFE
jgi:putative SOS response-associated peptidase YedK